MSDLEELAEAIRPKPLDYAGTGHHAYPPCPVCGYRGKARKQSKGSWVVVVLLAAFATILGFSNPIIGAMVFFLMLVYAAVSSGSQWVCGQCGAKKADA